MSLLDQKLLRDFFVIKGRVFSLILIIASGAAILFAILLALGNLSRTQEELLREMNFADLEVAVLPEDTHNIPDLQDISGLQEARSRLVFPSSITVPGKPPLAGLVLYQQSPTPEINKISIISGRTFRLGTREVVIDKALAQYHGYKVGDQIQVKVGKPTFDFTIVGIAMSPEFLITTSNPDYVFAEPGSLGVLWADVGQIRDAVGFSMVNSLLFKFKADADPQAVTGEILKRLAKLNIEKVIPQRDSYSHKIVLVNISAFRVYSPAIILTLCLLSIAMGIITFRRFIVEKQLEFGVLAALGMPRARVVGSLAKAGLAIGVAAGVLGVLFGWGMGWAFAEVYAYAMKLPFVRHYFDAELAFVAMAFALLTGVLTLLVAAAPMAGATPRQLLAPLASDRSNGAMRLSFGGSLSLLTIYGLRNLLRDKLLTLSSILAMGSAVGVAIAYGMAMTSMFDTVELGFDNDRWTHAVDFQYPLYADEVGDMMTQLGVPHREPYLRTVGDARHGDHHSIVRLVGLTTSTGLRKVKPVSGRLATNDKEAVISADLARDLAIGVGEDIELEKGSKTDVLKVVGLTDDIYLRTVNLTLNATQKLAQAEGKVSGAYVNIDDDAKAQGFLTNTDTVARVTNKASVVDHFRNEMSAKMGIVYITIIFSVAVSIIFVTTLIYLNISEKSGEYAVMRSLGFTARKLQHLMLATTGFQILIALLVATPVALALVQMLNNRMGKAWFAVNLHVHPSDFVWPMLAVLIVAPVAGMTGASAALKLDIPQYIRRRAI